MDLITEDISWILDDSPSPSPSTLSHPNHYPDWEKVILGYNDEEITSNDPTTQDQNPTQIPFCGRIPSWTKMRGRDLWEAWRSFFPNDNQAIESAFLAAEKQVWDKLTASQERLYRLKKIWVGGVKTWQGFPSHVFTPPTKTDRTLPRRDW